MLLLEALEGNVIPYFVQLLEAVCISATWPHSSIVKVSNFGPSLSQAAISLVLRLLPPFPNFKDLCDYIGLTQIIQNNLFILRSSAWQLFFTLYLFIYLFMAVLGLRFCARAFSSCGKRGPLFIAVRGPLTIVASLVAEHRLQMRRLSNCGSRAQLLCGMWDLPRPGLEPMSPALAGRFSTTVPPGKPLLSNFNSI